MHYTSAYLPSFNLQSAGVSVGVMDRLELSYAHQWFNTGSTGARLGLGSGCTFGLGVVGAKVRLFGDAVYDQDSWLPKGPCVYHGRSMATSHAELNLSRAKFNAVAENLQAAMKRAGIPYWTRNRLMVPLAPMQRDVVTQ